MRDILLLDSEERIKAFTHPYRMKILHVLRASNCAITATDVAKILGDGPGRVHYHMRILEAAGIVVVARTETVNGIIARFYEPTARHYSMSDAARGAVGGDSGRAEVARMISRRFREGLRVFLDRTTGRRGEPACGRSDTDAFLFELDLHCSDEEWVSFRDAVEGLAAQYASPTQDSRPRRVFIAGVTDEPGAETRGSVSGAGHSTWSPHPPPAR